MNNYHVILLCVTLLSNNATVSSEQEVKNMTLAEAITLALRYNRTVESAYLNRLAEKFDLKVAQDEFSPNFNISASIFQIHQDKQDSMNSQLGAGASLKIPTGGKFDLDLTQLVTDPWHVPADGFGNNLVLSFNQPLLKGGGVDVNRASQDFAIRREQANLLNLRSTLMDTITQVIYIYRNFLLAQRGMEINRLSLERSQHLLERNRILIEEGRLARVETIQAEADLANQELSFQENKNSLDNARLELLKLLDIDRHILIEPIESIQVKPVELNLEQLLQTVFTNQPNYLQTLLSHKDAKTNLLLAKNNQLWELDVQARYNITNSGDSWIDAQEKAGRLGEGDYSVGLSLRIPFGDYSLQQGLVNAKVALRQSEINLLELKENIEINIQDSVRNIQMQWKQVKLAQRAKELSQQQLEIALEKHKTGRATNFEIVSLQNALVSAENNEISTKVIYLNKLTSLDMMLGITLERWKINIETVRKVSLP